MEATYKVTDETVEKDETLQVIEVTVTVPETQRVDVIDVRKELQGMEHDRGNLEQIKDRMNTRIAKVNDVRVGAGFQMDIIAETEITYGVIPTVVEEVEK